MWSVAYRGSGVGARGGGLELMMAAYVWSWRVKKGENQRSELKVVGLAVGFQSHQTSQERLDSLNLALTLGQGWRRRGLSESWPLPPPSSHSLACPAEGLSGGICRNVSCGGWRCHVTCSPAPLLARAVLCSSVSCGGSWRNVGLEVGFCC